MEVARPRHRRSCRLRERKTFGFANQILIWLTVTSSPRSCSARTTFGRKLYAIGTNPTAALLAGVNVRRVRRDPVRDFGSRGR